MKNCEPPVLAAPVFAMAIVLSDTNTLAQNTPGYAVFGSVTTGMDVADKIAQIPVGGAPKNGNQPDMALQPAVITSTTVTTP